MNNAGETILRLRVENRRLREKLERCREFILRFDENDEAEIEFSKSISDLLEEKN